MSPLLPSCPAGPLCSGSLCALRPPARLLLRQLLCCALGPGAGPPPACPLCSYEKGLVAEVAKFLFGEGFAIAGGAKMG